MQVSNVVVAYRIHRARKMKLLPGMEDSHDRRTREYCYYSHQLSQSESFQRRENSLQIKAGMQRSLSSLKCTGSESMLRRKGVTELVVSEQIQGIFSHGVSTEPIVDLHICTNATAAAEAEGVAFNEVLRTRAGSEDLQGVGCL